MLSGEQKCFMSDTLKASIIGEQIRDLDYRLQGLLLDLYPLTIANAPMDAGDQRLFADDIAAHIGAIRAMLIKRKIR